MTTQVLVPGTTIIKGISRGFGFTTVPGNILLQLSITPTVTTLLHRPVGQIIWQVRSGQFAIQDAPWKVDEFYAPRQYFRLSESIVGCVVYLYNLSYIQANASFSLIRDI